MIRSGAVCCFSQYVEHVGATRIFARGTKRGTQMLAYSMNVRAKEPLAMILPLPVPPRSAEDAVRFIDLSAYATFFDDMHEAFPKMAMGQMLSRGAAFALEEPAALEVHQVGSFEASFVPTIADFARLDPRFRLSPEVWAKLPAYADWGFAVFRLSPDADQDQTVHPMAFEFPRRDTQALFFPTVHVHDGAVHESAHFDHDLYCQVDGILGVTLGWTRSMSPLGAHVEELKARGLVRASEPGFTLPLHGELPNQDTVLRRPEDVVWSGGDVVSAHGECWAVRLHGSHAGMNKSMVMPQRQAWCDTSRRHLDKIFAALRDGVPALVAQHGQGWGLAAFPGEIPSFWPNRYPSAQLPGVFLFNGELYTDRVEHQEVAFCFAQRPERTTELAIETEVRRLLDRALDG